MPNKTLIAFCLVCATALISCSESNVQAVNKEEAPAIQKENTATQEQHRYGGYYCPDNLGGFPAMDIANWKSVPVVNGRMPTREETQNGTSLIFVDQEKFPNAKPLDMEMPKLARFFNRNSGKEEIIIVIQALNVSNDSVVGFRYLNGGNGSAYMNQVRFLSDEEIESISSSRFVSLNINIDATKAAVWDVLTKPESYEALKAIFDKENTLWDGWNKSSKVNFKYLERGTSTSEYAGELYGNMYIQIDSERGDDQYVEKFFVSENEETKTAELVIACGPYGDDFERQEAILNKWAQKVKELSEKM